MSTSSSEIKSTLHGSDVVTITDCKSNPNRLLYRIDEKPSWYLSILLGFQHYLTMFGATIGLPFILSQYLCFGDDPAVISEVMSTIFFTSGIVTLLQTTFGVRLPIIQSGTYAFIAPTKAIMSIRPECAVATMISSTSSSSVLGTTMNLLNKTLPTTRVPFNTTSLMATTVSTGMDVEWKIRMREIQGAIIVSSLFQIVIGFTGIMGFVLKYVGPLTIAPTIALVSLPLFETAGFFAGAQWGIAIATMCFITLFSQVLKDVELPVGRSKFPIFKLFPVILAILLSWMLSAILTQAGVYKDDIYVRARTDYRSSVLETSSWFRVPYPGQWGSPTVSAPAVFGMLAGVLASMVESIGDYYACARLAGAPPPPQHALNRGIACEGIGCLITGLWGTGNGTTSYSENVGAIGITRVGSVRVIQCGAILMIMLSVVGKCGALFATIPDPVIGGIFIIMFGMITAVGLSSLQFVDMKSMRNLFVIGVSLFFGLVVPSYTKSNTINIANISWLSQIVQVFLSTHMVVGGVTGFLLDNTLPGTKEERGISKWKHNLDASNANDKGTSLASIHVYDPPFLTKKFLRSYVCKYLPFLPYYGNSPVNKDEDIALNALN